MISEQNTSTASGLRTAVTIMACLVFGALFLGLAQPAQAIIALPIVVLIPIAKMVAVIIGGVTVPAMGVSAVSSKLFGVSLKKTMLTAILFLFALGIALWFGLRWWLPDHPIY